MSVCLCNEWVDPVLVSYVRKMKIPPNVAMKIQHQR